MMREDQGSKKQCKCICPVLDRRGFFSVIQVYVPYVNGQRHAHQEVNALRLDGGLRQQQTPEGDGAETDFSGL